jgi:F-type H+-transporting ATPase subunit epsilon
MPLELNLVTPEKSVLLDTVDTLSLPTSLGEIGILPGHIPLLSLIEPGALKFSKQGKETILAIDQGFAQVQNDTVSILVEGAIHIQDIDLEALKEAQARAKLSLEAAKNANTQSPLPSSYLTHDLESFIRFSATQQHLKEENLKKTLG